MEKACSNMSETRLQRKVPYYLCKKDFSQVKKILQNFSCFDDYELKYFNESLEYNKIYGKMAYHLKEADVCNLGIYIATFHKNARSIDSDYIPKQFYTHFPNISKGTIYLMRNCLNNTLKNDKKKFISIFEVLDCMIDNYYFENLPKQIIHGDLHPGNIILDENGQFNLIDFFDFHYDYKIIDLAWLIIYYFFWDANHNEIEQPVDTVLIRKMIHCYNLLNPLTKEEIDAFEDVIKLLLLFSLFSNHSLWRNKRLGKSFYKNLLVIKELFEINKIDELNRF